MLPRIYIYTFTFLDLRLNFYEIVGYLYPSLELTIKNEIRRMQAVEKAERKKRGNTLMADRLPAGTAWSRPTDSICTPFARIRDTIWNCRRRERALPSPLSFGTPRWWYKCCVSSSKCWGRPRAGPYCVCSRWDCRRTDGLSRSGRTLSAGSQSGCNASGRRRCRCGCVRFLWDSSDREICPASWYQNDTRIRDQRLRRDHAAIPRNNVFAGLHVLPRRSAALLPHLPPFPISRPLFTPNLAFRPLSHFRHKSTRSESPENAHGSC